ncbi:MAG TPA: phage tail protein [Arenibaculum sp.]|nr:phage tail protein [Arenibaculum sp.]
MADWSQPLLTSSYTQILADLKARDTDTLTMLDGVTPTNLPAKTKRWNDGNKRFETWSGSAWSSLVLGLTGGGTGATTTAGARTALGLGSAAVAAIGTAPGQVVALDAAGKLPAVDGSALSGIVSVPAGAIMPFAGSTAPAGWLFCRGQAVSRTTYAALFGVLGTLYGSGDGSTTFNLPNLQDRAAVGSSGTKALGSAGGAASVATGSAGAHTHAGSSGSAGGHSHGGVTGARTLSEAQLANHAHEISPWGWGGSEFGSAWVRGTQPASTTIKYYTQSVGGGQAHNHAISADGAHIHSVTVANGGAHTHTVATQSPYLAINFIIKT